jgi:hypothetical protein
MNGGFNRLAKRAALLLAVGLLGALLAAPAASGQAALDQYVPKLEPGKRERAGGTPGGGGAGIEPALQTETPSGAPPVKTPDGEPGGGTLPGSDFPLTPFVLFVLLLLVAALIARVAWKRLRPARSPA